MKAIFIITRPIVFENQKDEFVKYSDLDFFKKNAEISHSIIKYKTDLNKMNSKSEHAIYIISGIKLMETDTKLKVTKLIKGVLNTSERFCVLYHNYDENKRFLDELNTRINKYSYSSAENSEYRIFFSSVGDIGNSKNVVNFKLKGLYKPIVLNESSLKSVFSYFENHDYNQSIKKIINLMMPLSIYIEGISNLIIKWDLNYDVELAKQNILRNYFNEVQDYSKNNIDIILNQLNEIKKQMQISEIKINFSFFSNLLSDLSLNDLDKCIDYFKAKNSSSVFLPAYLAAISANVV